MGWLRHTVQVTVLVSRHNSPRDAADDRLWEELRGRLREVCDDPRYQALHVSVEGLGGDDD